MAANRSPSCLVVLLALACFTASAALAQTTAFTYQGKLTDAGVPANGSFQMQFKLFDSLASSGQVGSTIPDVPVTAAEGIFSVMLDFGLNALSGANRWLEIAVRHNSGETYSTLSPREQIASSPYAVRTLSAATADNALSLGGVAAGQYLQANGSGANLTNLNAGNISTGTVSNARLGQIPTANIADSAVTASKIAGAQVVKSVNTLKDDVTLAAGANVTITPAGNTLTIAATGGTGGNAILNQTTLQSPANFNISGNGYIGGNAGVGTAIPSSKLDVRGNLTLDVGANPVVFTAASGAEQNRFLTLINSPTTQTASGLKAGGVLVSDDFAYANPGKNDLIVKGQIGIGTGTPGASLNVGGTGYGFMHSNGSVALSSYLDNSAPAAGWFGTKSSHPLYLFTNNAAQPQIAVTPDGRVGIGTDSPAARLTVSGSGAYNAVAAARFDMFNTVAGNGFLQNVTDGGLWQIATTGGATRMVINSSGNVGIGTTTPGSQLTINGSGTNGFALGVNGHAGQNLNSGGFVKAMIAVNSDGTVARCYNSITGSSTGGCGFGVVRLDNSAYDIDFGFQVSDRYALTGPIYSSELMAGNISVLSANVLRVNLRALDGTFPATSFVVVVF